jgi:uncharacterized membrane protein
MESTPEARSRDFERFVTLVDAIVAIAITLLVLPLVDIATELQGGSVSELLRAHLAEIGAFLLSFYVIGALWFDQHQLRRNVIAYDPLVARLMMLWTLTIVVLPFPTALVPDAGSQTATRVLYIGTMASSSAVLALTSWVIGRKRSIRDSDDKPSPAVAVGGTLALLVALAIALAFPRVGYISLVILLIPPRLISLWRWRRRRMGT